VKIPLLALHYGGAALLRDCIHNGSLWDCILELGEYFFVTGRREQAIPAGACFSLVEKARTELMQKRKLCEQQSLSFDSFLDHTHITEVGKEWKN
jgi:hypothetical protein